MNTTTNNTTAGDVPAFELIACGIITTRFLGPTNHRGARVKATSGSGQTLTVSWEYGLGIADNHAAAAAALAGQVLDCSPSELTLRGGCLANDGYAFAVARR